METNANKHTMNATIEIPKEITNVSTCIPSTHKVTYNLEQRLQLLHKQTIKLNKNIVEVQ